MTAISTLLRSDAARVCYLLVIEGWPHAFASDQAVVGSGVSSWIGTTYGARTVHGGLSLPRSIGYSLDLSPTSGSGDGALRDTGAEFRVLDLDGVLAPLLGNFDPSDLDYLATRLMPPTDPTAATAMGQGGGTIDIWGRHLGIEAIGPAGERRYFPCHPTATLPGLDHAALLDDIEGALAQVPVSDAPVLIDGRRVALYALVQDHDGTWASWGDQADGGALIWWGRLRGGALAEGRTWALRCDGPASWLRRTLNTNHAPVWRTAVPVFSLRSDPGEDETGIAVWCRKRQVDGTITANGVDLFGTAVTATTQAGIAAEVDGVIQAAIVAGVSTYKNHAPFGDATMLSSAVMRVRIEEAGSAIQGEIWVCLHWKVWTRIGFDPIYQQVPDGDQQTVYDVDFRKVIDPVISANGSDATVPGPGYWIGVFRTRALGAPSTGYSIDEACNGQAWRSHTPAKQLGTDVLDHLGGQEVEIGVDPIYLDGQLGRPPSTSTINGSATNASRWVLFRGAYRERPDEDPRERYQIAKVSYRTVDGEVQSNGTRTAIRVDYLEDPRLFGIDDTKLTRAWVLVPGGLSMLPLAALRWSAQGQPDFLHAALLRLLLSTGTATITGKDDDDATITLTPGDNDHADAGGTWHMATDAEIAELGLQIPQALVDWTSFRRAWDRIPGGHGGDLGRGVIAWSGPRQAEALIADVLRPRGLAMGLPGGKYGLIPVYDDIDPADAVATVGGSDRFVPGGPRSTPAGTAVTRYAEPFERVKVESGRHPADGSYQRADEYRARDRGVNARQGRSQVAHVIDGVPAGSDWLATHGELWGDVAAAWHAAPHVLLSGVEVARPKAVQLWPGDVVLVTTPWPPNGLGGYGFTSAPARVLSVRRDLGDLSASVDLLVQHGGGLARRWGPVARLVDDASDTTDRYDPATYTWKCQADAFATGETSDVAAFDEPSWSSVGGGALVYGWQWDGVTWSQSFSFTVASVDTSAHTITATGAYTGMWRERMYTLLVLAPYDSQSAAWPKSLYHVVTDPDGTFGAGPTKGWRMEP